MSAETILQEIEGLCDRYHALSTERESVYRAIGDAEQRLIDAVQEMELTALEGSGGLKARLRVDHTARVPRKEHGEAALAWLEANAPEMVDKRPRLPAWQTEQRFWLERVERGEAVPPFVVFEDRVRVDYGGTIHRPRNYQYEGE